MTNKEIRYELFECIATSNGIKSKLTNNLDIMATELMIERLVTMFDYFNSQYEKEIKVVDDLIKKTML